MTAATGISLLYPGRPTIDKAPDAVLEYAFDWSDWLAESGDELATVDVTPVGDVVVSNVGEEAGVVSLLASGGTIGSEAGVTCRVVTTSVPPRRDSRSIWFNIVVR
jgi:hypothetical protein